MTGEKKLAWVDFVWFALRVAIGFTFAYAGFMKLIEPIENFESVVSDYDLFSRDLVPVIARTVPWIELIGGTFLLLGYAPKFSSATIGALALAFSMLLGASILAGKGEKSCGCFGESGIKLSANHMFVLDLLVCISSARMYLFESFPLSLHAWLIRR
ncbi:MAG: DoxX family membrane protein [Candidatus Omnitrophica bacterium]|nr:DoxX family membrane protein [Candidatus Omnitrophota bacterium]